MSCVEMMQAQAPLAQLAEHLTLNQGVQGSNPWRRMKDYRIRSVVFFYFKNIDKDVIVEITVVVNIWNRFRNFKGGFIYEISGDRRYDAGS